MKRKKVVGFEIKKIINCTRCDQKIPGLFISNFINTILFSIHIITFKLIFLGSNTPLLSSFPLLKTFLLGTNWNVLKIDFRILLNVINCLKTRSFERRFTFRNKKKLHGASFFYFTGRGSTRFQHP